MNIRTTLLTIGLPALLSLSACTGTETGNPFTQPLTVDAHSSNPGEVEIAIPAGGVLVTEAWLSIDEVGISEECSTAKDETVGNLGVADHAEDEALRVEFTAKTRSYCEMQVPWVIAADDAPVPSEVVGTAIFLAGQSAAGTTFVLRSALTGVVVVSAVDESFELSEPLGGLFLGFDLATWLGGIDLDSAVLAADNSILIDGTSNTNLLTIFESNVAAGLELYRDTNKNGRPDEATDVVLARGQ
jgi:hypothetical protein